MKEIISYNHEIESVGAKVGGSFGVSGQDLQVNIHVAYPIEKVVEPALKVVDNLIDKIEKLIPGDQTATATVLKAEAREELVKLLSE